MGPGDDQEMHQRLQRLKAFNRSDSLFTTTAETQFLASYFDRRGTADEQMLAYYLLGRAYADTHEAPLALHYYLEAIGRADPASPDCDLAQLSRVHGQAATIFYHQNLYRHQLAHLALAEHYAWLASDTLAALLFHAHQASAYDQLQLPDSALFVYRDAYHRLRACGYSQVAAGFTGGIAEKLIDRGEVAEAANYLRIYEQESGFVNEQGQAVQGREIYHYWKGLYNMAIQRYDAAEHSFRQVLARGRDFNHQNCGAYGLARLFRLTHRPDSAAKYALYAYEMNDSVYALQATEAVEQAKSMYDYTRHQEEARRSRQQAEHSRAVIWILVVVAIVLLVCGLLVWRWQYSRQQRSAARYRQLLESHHQLLSEIQRLRRIGEELRESRHHEEELNKLISEKEQLAQSLQQAIILYQQKEQMLDKQQSDWRDRLATEPSFRQLSVKAAGGQQLTGKDWEQVEQLMEQQAPDFCHFLDVKSHLLSAYERQICLLTCLFIRPKQISYLLGVDDTYISKMRTAIVRKLFNGQRSKELDGLLLALCWNQGCQLSDSSDEPADSQSHP